MCIENVRVRDETVGRIKKLEISSDESQWLSRPDTGIRSIGDALETLALLQSRLGIFCHARPSKNAKTEPIPNGMHETKKARDQLSFSRNERSGMLRQHSIGEWFLLGLWFRPVVSLRDHFLEIGMQ
jgi:hypothetical protein